MYYEQITVDLMRAELYNLRGIAGFNRDLVRTDRKEGDPLLAATDDENALFATLKAQEVERKTDGLQAHINRQNVWGAGVPL